jgi:hypothetical protein
MPPKSAGANFVVAGDEHAEQTNKNSKLDAEDLPSQQENNITSYTQRTKQRVPKGHYAKCRKALYSISQAFKPDATNSTTISDPCVPQL